MIAHAAIIYDGVAAGVAAIGALFASYLSYKARAQSKTTNGHTIGELVEDIAERLTRIEEWFVDHLRDHLPKDKDP